LTARAARHAARGGIEHAAAGAVTLLNDTVFLEAARGWGDLAAAREAESDGTGRGLAVRPLPVAADLRRSELSLVIRFYESQAKRFAAGELDPAPACRAGTVGIGVGSFVGDFLGERIARAASCLDGDGSRDLESG
jgi:hypothetical protein